MPTNEGAQTFDEWWAVSRTQPPYSNPEAIAKSAWNAGVSAACDHFGSVEGADHGAEEQLRVK